MKKIILFLFIGMLAISACKKEDVQQVIDELATGWLGTDESDKVPENVDVTVDTNLPSSYDLTPHMPPIGDQGQYGTCVAWAVGYNFMTAIEGLDKGLSASQLASKSNQISPKDLFLAIPDSYKGASDCNGTNFDNALDVLQQRGAASMATVPYGTLSSCSQSNSQASWTSEAANHKIKYYRKIDQSVNAVRQQIASKVPVICGVIVQNEFYNVNSDDVFSGGSGGASGQHGYHAMCVVGYDDNKGPNGAFKVVNSWATVWGAQGFVWVDYNYFISQFVFDNNLYIADNQQGDNNVPPAPDPTVTGVDLAMWIEGDLPTGSGTTERKLTFNLYNVGNAPAPPSKDWSLYYIYYNAYDANDYGLILADDFTDNDANIPSGYFDCPTDNQCTINETLQAGSNFSQMLFANDDGIAQTYYMPDITGYYYLVAVADIGDVFTESDEQNNVYYTTEQDPIYFENGYGFGNSGDDRDNTFKFEPSIPFRADLLHGSKYNTAVNAKNNNAYTFGEIKRLLKRERANGGFQRKIQDYKARVAAHGGNPGLSSAKQ